MTDLQKNMVYQNNTYNSTIPSSFENSFLVESQSFIPNEYCSIGNFGCSFIIIVNTLPFIYLIWMLYKAIPQWKSDFSYNKTIFYQADGETHTIRNINSYGLKVFLNIIAALQALINAIIIPSFHYKGWMVIMQINITNFIFCFLISVFIYLDAITFHITKRHTLYIALINILQNIVVFSILLATQNGKHIDIFCFINSALYVITCMASSIYILISPLDTVEIVKHKKYSDMLNHSHLSSSNNILNTSADQNLLQQHTTFDYGQGHSSNSQLYQPPSYHKINQHSPTKQSKIEDEKSTRSNKSIVSSTKNSNQNFNNPSNNNTNTNKNHNLNISNNQVNITQNNVNLSPHIVSYVQRSQSAKNQAIITPEDSFNSINNHVSDDDDDETCDQKSNKPSNKISPELQGQRDKLNLKEIKNEYLDQQYNETQGLTSYQIQRINLNNRSQSSIQCLGRQDANQSNEQPQKNLDIKDKNRIDQKISDFFLSEKLSGSVDIMGKDEKDNLQNNIDKIQSNLKHNQQQQIFSQQRQQLGQVAGEGNNLYQSVDYMGCSNQFVTPSFNNNVQGLDQQSCNQTNSSSNRDSLYLSQQITTPQFNHINQFAASSNSSNSSKKPIVSIFSQNQNYNTEEQYSKKPSIFSSNQIAAEQQSPLIISCSISLGAESQDTHGFGSATMNSNEISEDMYSNQKQDSFQTSDSYLMNGGQNTNQIQGQSKSSTHNVQTQNQLLQQQQNAFEKAINDSKTGKSLQTNKNISNDDQRKKSQNSKHLPQQDLAKKQKKQNNKPSQDINKTNLTEQQHILNQMNDLLFKNRSQQQSQNQHSPLLVQDSSDRQHTKQQRISMPDQEKLQNEKTPNNSPKDQFSKEMENYNQMQSSRNSDNLQQQNQKSSSNDSLDENIGYYRERYSELTVFSFNQSEKFEKRTVVFNISYFDSKGEKIIIQRSYREFNDLHKYLSIRFKGVAFSQFPKKQNNKLQLSSQELADRKSRFNSYLKSVVSQIKIENPVINHFLSKDTICFSSQSITNKLNPTTPLTPSEQTKSFAQQNKHTYKKLNSLPLSKPRSVPETIMEDSNDRSNVLTDSNTSQTENDEDYSTMSCNYQVSNKGKQHQPQVYMQYIKSPSNSNQFNSTIITNSNGGYSSQSSKTVSPNPSRKTSAKQ